MNNIQINAKKDFFQRISSTSSINAVAELIWNSLDAGANKIEVIFDDNGKKVLYYQNAFATAKNYLSEANGCCLQ